MPTVPGHTSARTPEHCACPARGTYHLPYRAAQSREQSSGVIEHVQSVSWCPFPVSYTHLTLPTIYSV